MLKEIEGMIIREIPYGETSKIIHVYTIDGVISIMCKGAKQLKSHFEQQHLNSHMGVLIFIIKKINYLR